MSENATTDATAASDSTETESTTTTKPDDALGAAGKAALDAERKARKDAEVEAKRLQKIVDDAAAAKAKADDDEAKRKGEFEKLANERETERDAATADVTRLSAENDQLKAAVNAILDAEWKALPKEIKDLYLGDEGDPLARLTFLPKAKVAAKQHETANGNGANPPAAGGARPTVEQTRDEMRRLRGFPSRHVRS